MHAKNYPRGLGEGKSSQFRLRIEFIQGKGENRAVVVGFLYLAISHLACSGIDAWRADAGLLQRAPGHWHSRHPRRPQFRHKEALTYPRANTPQPFPKSRFTGYPG